MEVFSKTIIRKHKLSTLSFFDMKFKTKKCSKYMKII